MKICQCHWDMMRKCCDDRGLSGLIAKDGETTVNNMIADLQEKGANPQHERFDPLMSLHWHYMNGALENGGLYLLSNDPDGNPYCPVCEYEKHIKNFDAESDINRVGDQIQAWCREQGLIPAVN